jgi:hypothetical protein
LLPIKAIAVATASRRRGGSLGITRKICRLWKPVKLAESPYVRQANVFRAVWGFSRNGHKLSRSDAEWFAELMRGKCAISGLLPFGEKVVRKAG